ncbi:hypothetical protein UFO1_3426 [Pelosinus sp. UFO1]|nr:hypothetical protein UFO1_3426 [Pelosinus sp. UFO1]
MEIVEPIRNKKQIDKNSIQDRTTVLVASAKPQKIYYKVV